MPHRLYPPLERLRRELFDSPASPESSERLPDQDAVQEDTPPPAMPDFIREHIARTVAAQLAHVPSAPAVGQIRALSAVNAINDRNSRPLGRNVGVLLGAHLGGKQWQGWLVTADTDYATDRDLLIEDDDGPADPQAGMVMTRLPLRAIIPGDAPILAKLSPARLGAVIALAEAPTGAEPIPPRPGHIFARDLDAEHVGITGSPLGGPGDPRHAYRALHRQLADEMSSAAEALALQTEEQPSRSGFFAWLFSRHWAPAPVLAALIAVISVQNLWLNVSDDETRRYRGHSATTTPCATVARLRVVFKASAPQEAVVLLLRKAEVRVVSGPSEIGEWWLGLPADASVNEALAQLRNSPLVADIIVVETKEAACQP
ncbi:hypothetical protein [Azonexus sp.]|uniref:hypothetical protein n=1 Tax=Azonexus sp. TaxID=1872668 RepID=UPI0035B4DB15